MPFLRGNIPRLEATYVERSSRARDSNGEACYMIRFSMEPVHVGNFIGGREPSKQAKPGRTCAEPACRTPLSVYNLGSECATHKVRGIRTTPETEVWEPPKQNKARSIRKKRRG
jgi:hypothetical protein